MSDSQSEKTSDILLKPTEVKNAHDVESGSQPSTAAQNCKNRDYRVLAISSIICGLSCIGIMSMIFSVKTRTMNKRWLNSGEEGMQEKAKEYSRKTLTYGILAIIVWVVILICTPLLVGLVSYLLTLKD
ncbi:transmembrane protein 265 [Astyanax mexicanus]|uniref:Transmembrane protein 265 n=1 Tax=Astyanax mexicanus TaxID=7994 RepID=A0A8T2KYV6_ASTMX|nr:transmembrane protein 265 [Astyanax mexicanus]